MTTTKRFSDNDLTILLDLVTRRLIERQGMDFDSIDPAHIRLMQEDILPVIVATTDNVAILGYSKDEIILNDEEYHSLPAGSIVRDSGGDLFETASSEEFIFYKGDLIDFESGMVTYPAKVFKA